MNPYETRFNNYPIDAFYAETADAANEVMRITQTPSGLVGMEFVGVAADNCLERSATTIVSG